MTLTANDEQRLLQESARSFLQARSPTTRMRALRDGRDETGFSPTLWQEMAELGWLGVPLPEAHGGAGMGLSETAVLLTEFGRVLAPEPLLSSVVIGAGAVHASDNVDLHADVLPKVAAGERLLALALEETGRFDPLVIATRAEPTPDGHVLTGAKRYVLDGHTADQFVVVARTAGAPGDPDGIVLLLVDARAPGIDVQRTTMMDGRNAAHVTFADVTVSADRRLGDAALLETVLDRATLGLAAEMVGVADAAFEETLQYLKDREQFGVKIGTFQALRHRAAEMFAELEFARTLVLDGAAAIDEARADASLSVSAAKAQANKAARRVGAESIQIHGGMGMTDELDIGLFFKRLRVADLTFGDEHYHLRRFASLRGY